MIVDVHAEAESDGRIVGLVDPRKAMRTALPELQWRSLLHLDAVRTYYSGMLFQRPVCDDEIRALKRRSKVTQHLQVEHPPKDLVGFREWLAEIEADVPEKYRKSIRIEFESEGDPYDSGHHLTVEATYQRPETDEEFAARKADVSGRLKAIEDHDAKVRRQKNRALATALGGSPIE